MDLRGLAALSSRILSLLNHAENLGQEGLELFGVSRICEKRSEHSRARKLYEKSIASILPVDTDRAARRSLARLAKREGDFQRACELWKDATKFRYSGAGISYSLSVVWGAMTAPTLLAALIGDDVLHKWYYLPIVYAVYCIVAMLSLLFIPETRDMSLEDLDQQQPQRAAAIP